MALLVRPALRWLVIRLSDGPARGQLALLVAAGVLLCYFATSLIGLHGIFGAFAFGLAMPREPAGRLRAAVQEPLERSSSLLLPVFFTITGLSVNVTSLTGTLLLEFAIILLVACAGKLLGGVVPARLSGLSWREAATIGVLMNTRGATELVILSIGVSLGVLDSRLFTVGVLMALVTTGMAGILLPRREKAAADMRAAAGEAGQTQQPAEIAAGKEREWTSDGAPSNVTATNRP
jgi:Kef-type K+ transport system membrane component KefB